MTENASDTAYFSDMLLDLHASSNGERTVQRIVEYAVPALECDGATILLLTSRANATAVAYTSEATRRADELELELDEGPCLDALENDGFFVVGDTNVDQRWPRWSPQVAELGFLSVMGVPLQTREQRYGSLNLFACHRQAFDSDGVAVAAIFARHAAVALAHSSTEDNLHHALDARKLIGQAQGILMERFELDADRAFDVLRRYSQDTNTKLRDVAGLIVTHRGQQGDPTAGRSA